MARSERFELPTLGIEIRCSIQLSYERARCPAYQRCRGAAIRQKSEAGMAVAVLADIGGRALVAPISRWAVIIGEAAGHVARAVIVEIADPVGQPVPAVGAIVGMAGIDAEIRRVCQPRCEGGC